MPAPGPKRILALDGGGIRGVFSLMILAKVEALFRAERKQPGLVLRDAFDFFAGTSTGAIIATCLAWGMSTAQIIELYEKRGAEMFAKAPFLQRYWKGLYRPEVIARVFQELFHEDDKARTPAQLGTARLWAPGAEKYLLVVMRNATTGSPWPVTNNPRAKYNLTTHEECNLRIPLWQLLRASTAAPVYFPPEAIQLGARPQPTLFVDGGMTPYNNPALIAALMATLPPYRIEWPTGRDRLHLLSIGTGNIRALLTKPAQEINNADFLEFITPALLGTVGVEQDTLCRVLGDCVFGDRLDGEVGTLHGPGLLTAAEKKFSYVRYNREFTSADIQQIEHETGQKFGLDNTALIQALKQAGAAYAHDNVKKEHLFPG